MPNQGITKADLDQFTGTTRYFQHWSKSVVYTEGMFFLAEAGKAFWLLDLIASYQPLDCEFQRWTLEVEDDFYTIVCEDENNVIKAKQNIEYTDLPESLMPLEIYVRNGVIYLPSED